MKRPSKEYMQTKTWEEKAQENPLYGVMSHEEFVESSAEPTPEELDVFYKRGVEMVSLWIAPWLEEKGIVEGMKVLEFGCGMGRLTNAIAERFSHSNVFGIDISKTMISHAEKNTAKEIQYSTVGDGGQFPFEDELFDRIYSYAVFQHISEKSVVEKSIGEIARSLKVGGHVKLNIEMAFKPPFENTLNQDTYAFENSYISHGWKKVFGIPIWGFKLKKSNNWTGIRLGYKQLIKLFRQNNIQIDGISREPTKVRQVWFYGTKLND